MWLIVKCIFKYDFDSGREGFEPSNTLLTCVASLAGWHLKPLGHLPTFGKEKIEFKKRVFWKKG